MGRVHACFHFHIRKTLEYYNGLDILDSFVPPVMDGKTRFDGINPSIVRDYFNQWARTACETEQGVSFKRASRAKQRDAGSVLWLMRRRCCLF